MLPGGDWLLIDPTTGVVTINAHYQILTTDGELIYVVGSGVSTVPAPSPDSFPSKYITRVSFETGSQKYYWLNDILTVGDLSFTGDHDASYKIWLVSFVHLIWEVF